MDTKPCRACGGTMILRVQPGTRDERFGGSFYCESPECGHREWNAPNFQPKDESQPAPPDWKQEEYEKRKATGPTIVQITPQIAIGDLIDAWLLRDAGSGKPFDAILNVCQKAYDAPPDVEYSQIPLTEYGSRPAKKQRREADFARAVQQLETWVAEGKRVLVHCVAGANRSVSVIVAALIGQGMSYREALDTVREHRPIAYPHGEIDLTLRQFAEDRRSAKRSATRIHAASEAAEIVSRVDWTKSVEENLLAIQYADQPLKKYDHAGEFFEAAHPAAERFIRSDLLITQAMGQAVTASQKTAEDWQDPLGPSHPSPPPEKFQYFDPRQRTEKWDQYSNTIRKKETVQIGAYEWTLDDEYVGNKGKRREFRKKIPITRNSILKGGYLDIRMFVYPAREQDFQAETPEEKAIIRKSKAWLADMEIYYRTQMFGQEDLILHRERGFLDPLRAHDHLEGWKRSLDSMTVGDLLRSAEPARGALASRTAAKPKIKQKGDAFSGELIPSGRPKILPFEMNPRDDIKRVDPATAYTQLLSRRGLKVPSPEVFNSERYQTVLQRAPLIPLDPRDPRSIDRAIMFVQQTRGLLIESNQEEAPQEYYRVPTKFGSRRIDHIMYATWFAMFSPNTAVESEETSFVLWHAGQSGTDPGKPGIMCKKDKILYWLNFLKWAGFPRFNQLYKTLEGFDPSDESYERRMIALARQPGIQFKVGSFMLALLGDTRSPTLDMHALGYLMQTGKLDVPQGMEWYPLNELAQEANALDAMYAESEANFQVKMDYTDRKKEYDRKAEMNKKIIGKLTAQMRITKDPPKTEKGLEGEKRKVREYIRRQMEGWNGDTNTFWAWYAKNEYFKTHEPRRSMIHTVFFQSLFPELFTPEALQQRDMVQQMGDPELRTEEQEDRAKYRDYEENLQQMREIQKPFMTKDKSKLKPVPKRKVPPPRPAAPPPDENFDWEMGA